MLTKENYKAIANIINNAAGYIGDDSCYQVLIDNNDSIIPALANYFSSKDPDFVWDKFIKECGWS